MGKKGARGPAPHSKGEERSTKQAFKKAREKQTWGVEAGDLLKFERQLEALGLVLKDVKGDGNCLFRALGDQLRGDAENHMAYRTNTINYIREHKEDFEPFMEDDSKTFDQYVHLLGQDGTYAGHWALIGFSRHYNVNITIHQLDQSPWKILVSNHPNVPSLHIAYFGYEHYSSVRNEHGPHHGPAEVRIKEKEKKAEEPPAQEAPGKSEGARGKAKSRAERQKSQPKKEWSEPEEDPISWSERMVMEASGSSDLTLIRSLLLDTNDDVDSVVGMLLGQAKAQSSASTSAHHSELNDALEDHVYLDDELLDSGIEQWIAEDPAQDGVAGKGEPPKAAPEPLDAKAGAPPGDQEAKAGKGKAKARELSAREKKELAKKLKKENRARALREQATTAPPEPAPSGKEILI